ncbi:hypothetical protein BJY16_005730 [Actinoplanes octamycinicus]|uniref:Uncharacterized protein n=1 Tax=Actinoplanes octamycinicus TaxID=135948 RepID=A0A7W7H1J0_9ACTN|nr:hypothetical protein [Actinoplanes octamycinicus]MBB4742271.1 hypothetical protein [Actinoplanes octamycinicus]GIE59884.1 hypothetical protein Aoc01nite_52860 [Actinoplanes octamycinicus]
MTAALEDPDEIAAVLRGTVLDSLPIAEGLGDTLVVPASTRPGCSRPGGPPAPHSTEPANGPSSPPSTSSGTTPIKTRHTSLRTR